MLLRRIPRGGAIALAALVGGLSVALAFAFLLFGMSRQDIGTISLYLLLSGSISLALSLGASHLGLRNYLSIRYKIALAGGIGSAVALVNILITALLMFLSSHDLALLMVLALFSLSISWFFSFAVSQQITTSLEKLAQGTRKLAQGDLATRLEVFGKDEVAELAETLNIMAEELERAFRRQRELEQARQDLIASISHDLRTPLASMRVMVEAVSDGVVSDQATIRRYCATLKEEVEHLSALINDLFELSRLDSGMLELHLKPSSVGEILDGVLEYMKVQAAYRALDLQGQWDAELEPVLVDSHQIQRVLYNLIQNAIRHTPADGTILVEAQDMGPMVQIDIADTGQGITAEDLDKVFDRFYRGEKSRSRGHGGAGLGLAIAKGIVEAHGGRIWVNSSPGQGSCFSFWVPKARVGSLAH